MTEKAKAFILNWRNPHTRMNAANLLKDITDEELTELINSIDSLAAEEGETRGSLGDYDGFYFLEYDGLKRYLCNEYCKRTPTVHPESNDNISDRVNLVVGNNCETIGYNYNKMAIISAFLEGKKIVLLDEGEEYKSLADALGVNTETKLAN